MRNLVEWFYNKIKGRHLLLDPKISSSDLFFVSVSQGVGIMRGVLRLLPSVFIGKSVKLKSRKNLHIGKGATIKDYCTLDALGHSGIKVGKASTIGAYSFIQVSGSLTDLGLKVHIGDNVGIGEFAHIGGAGGVLIGNDTIIGSYFSVHPENHNFSHSATLIKNQGVNRKGIIIGANCWIGAKVTVLDGSRIGDGCVVAAGAVVKGNYPDNVIIGGVPSKILGDRISGKK
ncbi:DapH/DapD/GlmU-related protein [Shewanella sp. S1-49-MNA-CIBAN-0167]|uniref:acyltransferase n=1 Tax=Shewanella sp. S1-49-MNA-CIBAN-0167 TaxID=3140468 RepID=UPI003316C9B1